MSLAELYHGGGLKDFSPADHYSIIRLRVHLQLTHAAEPSSLGSVGVENSKSRRVCICREGSSLSIQDLLCSHHLSPSGGGVFGGGGGRGSANVLDSLQAAVLHSDSVSMQAGHACIALDLRSKVPTGQHTLSISPGHGLAPNTTITAELLYVETEEPRGTHNALPLRSSLTPTKKVDVDRTIMPDGTIVTTVTTVQSRLKLDRSPGDSPACSPSKVEVTEKKPTILSDGLSSPSPNLTKNRLSNGLDPVAETAIRQLTESASKVARKTPTKRSTLIISGVSKVPLTEDDCALSSGYAAAMDAAMHGNHYGAGHHQDPDETTPSDVSERPSVDDVESDTGSTGALETRSLKDHKVGFLQSGTMLLFRRRHRQKESCLSQSHEDISNMGNNFAAAASINRKKSGSFSRRLIKRFSFRSSGKSKGKASNGGGSALDN